MNENKETSLIVKNDTFIGRLKAFFKLFFSYFGIETKNDSDYSLQEVNPNNFNESLNGYEIQNAKFNNLENIEKRMDSVESTFTQEEYKEKLEDLLLQMQSAYENGALREDELSLEHISDLKTLYSVQIKLLKEEIEKNLAVISKLKEKIDILNNSKK